MRLVVATIGFLLGSIVEVSVQAAERVQLTEVNLSRERLNVLSSALLEEPKFCISNAPEMGKCALRSGPNRKLTLEPSAGRVWTLGENTIILRLGTDRLRFVEGSMRLGGESTKLETEHGELMIQGEAFVERHGSTLSVINTGDGRVEFQGRGWKIPSEIPQGQEAHFELPNIKSGMTETGLPLPLNFDSQVVREARLYKGKKSEFAMRLEYLAELRRKAAAESASFHQAVVERKIATVAAKDQLVKESRMRREARDRELRALFRRKVLNPE